MWPGERLLWHGAPDPRVRFTQADMFRVPFSIFWCAFFVRWWFGVVAEGAPAWFYLVGAPLTGAGLYMLAGRFAYKRYRKTRTTYGITADRAIISGPGLFADMPLRGQPVTYRPSRDWGHVTVVIGDFNPSIRRRGSPWVKLFTGPVANTGMEPLHGRAKLPFALYDVANPDTLLEALARTGAHPRRLGA